MSGFEEEHERDQTGYGGAEPREAELPAGESSAPGGGTSDGAAAEVAERLEAGELEPLPSEQMDEMRAKLLQGEAQWHYFLDAKEGGEIRETGGGQDGALEVEEVGRMVDRRRASANRFEGLPMQTVFCSACGAPGPADLNFCVHCGGEPDYRGPIHSHLLVVEEITEASLLDAVTDVLHAANDGLTRAELRDALEQPPSVFHFRGHALQAVALAERLGEMGARTSSAPLAEPDAIWVREILESVARRRAYLLTWLMVAGAAIGVGLGVGLIWGLVTGLMGAAGLGIWQHRRYLARYDIDAVRVVNALNGLTSAQVAAVRRTLGRLVDEEVRGVLTICLMEYYAIWKQLNGEDRELRVMLERLRGGLHEIIDQIVRLCGRYADLHSYLLRHEPDEIRDRIAELEERLGGEVTSGTDRLLERELEQRRQQLEVSERLERLLPEVRDRLDVMVASMESLRARVVSSTISRRMEGGEEERFVVLMLEELDEEVQVFEEAFAEVEVIA